MKAAHLSPINEAIAFVQEAKEAACRAQEFGASFDFHTTAQILTDDKRVHERIVTKSAVAKNQLRSITADGKVDADEVAALKRMIDSLSDIEELAQPV